mgnify:CR=1 FL=1|jgi:hypothetical protein|tara:strand:- start:107 stop:346 length:240 start_codon:yes stop_codon:yes gene_type:complete
MSIEAQVVYLSVEEIYALEGLIEDFDFEDTDEETAESLKSASESLATSRHYRENYNANDFIRLSSEEKEALKKLREQTN